MTLSRKQRESRRACEICDRLQPLEQLIRAGYEEEDGQAYGSGLVCARCCHDLPLALFIDGRAILLVCRAP